MDKRKEINRAIQHLRDDEVRQLLGQVMLRVEIASHDEDKKEKLHGELAELYDKLSRLQPEQLKPWEPDEGTKRVHIVCGESFAGSLKVALRKLERRGTDKLIVLPDPFSTGPIWKLHEPEGRAFRQEWIQDHINTHDEDVNIEEKHQTIVHQLSLIPKGASVTLWYSDNASEYAGLLFGAYLLKDHPNEIYVRNTIKEVTQLPSISEHREEFIQSGSISSDSLMLILQDECALAPLSSERRRGMEDEWLTLSEDRSHLRIWQEGRLVSVEENYWDESLVDAAENIHILRGNRDFIKSARVIGQVLGQLDQAITDSFLEYRLRELIYSGRLQMKGVPRAMRYYSVRKADV
ncbi:DUF1835 domain-containing protein [Paenibacillus sp. GCM10027627]|uniref:DUF1835 domain-containing protein n=1 Tax=unclassified Paenibacillus TaxID=185978 RepID=UPI00363FF600